MIANLPLRIGAAVALGFCLTAVAARGQFFTGPYGNGGSWNLYQVVPAATTWTGARAAAKAKTAASTGLPGLSSLVTGHLVQIGSQDENSFVAASASVTPGMGNSNIWLGMNDLDAPEGPGEKGASRTGWRWTDAGDQIDPGDFAPWAPGEPNNAGGVEDAGEMRVDGSWNDANVTATRRYVIEWDLNASAPVAGAAQYPVYYTGPYGTGGSWNLYHIVLQGETWDSARAAAHSVSAKATGLPGVAAPAYDNLMGHLVSLNTEAEHHFIYQAMAFGSLNSIGYWTGGTDREAEGGDGRGLDPLAGWRWADETPALRSLSWHRFPRRPFFAMEKPGDNGGAGDVIEVSGAGFWNDTDSLPASALRRYVVEWNTEQAGPVAGAAGLSPMLQGSRSFAGVAGTDRWNVKGTVFTTKPTSLNNITAALSYVNSPPPTGSTQEVTTPVLNNTDSNPAENPAGRSTLGLFWPRQPLANDTANVDDDYYLVDGRTRINCLAGTTYTINVHSDDGFYLRVTGSGGNKAVFSKVGGLGGIDESDASAIFFLYGTSDSSTRGVFTVSASGVYEVEYVGFDATGGSFQEVSWAPVEALNDWDTGEWKLMGGTPAGSPQLPPAGALPGPAGSGQKWGTRAAAVGLTPSGIPGAVTALQSAANPLDQAFPVINYNDPQNPGSRFRFARDFDSPGNTGADDNQFVVAAKTNFLVPAAGPFTLCVRADDNFALRVVGQKWAGRVISYTPTTTSTVSNGFIDPLDPSTLFWLPGPDSNARAVINFPAAGSYALEFLHYEGTGGAGAEIYYAPGICASDLDSTEWRLIGDTSAYTPALPGTLPGPPGDEGLWSLEVLEAAGIPVTSVDSAIAALKDGRGTHHQDRVPVLNHIVASNPGSGGMFGGDLELPGIDAANNTNLAIHARARVIIPATGFYTFVARSGDGWALRLKGAVWLDRLNAGVDPADGSTMIYNVTGAADAPNDFRGGGVVYLNAGSYETDFITFQDQRDTQFELYAAAGNLLDSADTAALGVANAGDAGPGAAWRLVGHKSQGIFPRLGVAGPWTVKETKPQATPYPGNGTLAGALAWLAQPAATNGLTTTAWNMINFNDPGFGGPGSIVNDAAIPRNTPGSSPTDDNYFATRMEGLLRVPSEGFYSIGWQGDDGGFLEFINPPYSVSFNRLVGNATNGSVITNSSDGTVNGRIQFDGNGGNTRTIGEIFLPAGDYPVSVLWFENTGSAYFEVFAASSGQEYSLITTTSGSTATAPLDSDGLQLGPALDPIEVVRVSLSPERFFSFTWVSQPDKTYLVERSTDLLVWSTVAPVLPSGGALTTYTSEMAMPATRTRYFYRAREL